MGETSYFGSGQEGIFHAWSLRCHAGRVARQIPFLTSLEHEELDEHTQSYPLASTAPICRRRFFVLMGIEPPTTTKLHQIHRRSFIACDDTPAIGENRYSNISRLPVLTSTDTAIPATVVP